MVTRGRYDTKDYTFVIKVPGRDWTLDPGNMAVWTEWEAKLAPRAGSARTYDPPPRWSDGRLDGDDTPPPLQRDMRKAVNSNHWQQYRDSLP